MSASPRVNPLPHVDQPIDIQILIVPHVACYLHIETSPFFQSTQTFFVTSFCTEYMNHILSKTMLCNFRIFVWCVYINSCFLGPFVANSVITILPSPFFFSLYDLRNSFAAALMKVSCSYSLIATRSSS